MPVEMTSLALAPDTVLSFARHEARELTGMKLVNLPGAQKTLKLANTTGMNVAYKVKTTAPKCYLVKPSSGNLARGGSIDIQITLQPDKGDGASPASHRFLVQAHPVDHDQALTSEQWADIPKDAIQEKRLSVVLEESGQGATSAPAAATTAAAPAAAAAERALPAQKAPIPETYGDLKALYEREFANAKKMDQQQKGLEAELQSLKQDRGGSAKKAAGGISPVMLVIVFAITLVMSFFAQKAIAPASPQ